MLTIREGLKMKLFIVDWLTKCGLDNTMLIQKSLIDKYVATFQIKLR